MHRAAFPLAAMECAQSAPGKHVVGYWPGSKSAQVSSTVQAELQPGTMPVPSVPCVEVAPSQGAVEIPPWQSAHSSGHALSP